MRENQNKYITEMKELPPETVSEHVDSGPKTENMVPMNTRKSDEISRDPEKDMEDENIEKQKLSDKAYEESLEALESNNKSFTNKDLILGVINLLCIVVIVFLVIKFPEKSQLLKNERNQMLLNDSGLNYEFSEINVSKKKADEMAQLFADDSGVTDFLNEIGIIQTSTGLIKKISFGNQKAVEDKATGLSGVPVIIEFSGSLPQILSDIEKIQKLPFVLRAISIDSLRDEKSPEIVNLKYGAFLYVDGSLKQ
jgi:hypothetical protein